MGMYERDIELAQNHEGRLVPLTHPGQSKDSFLKDSFWYLYYLRRKGKMPLRNLDCFSLLGFAKPEDSNQIAHVLLKNGASLKEHQVDVPDYDSWMISPLP